MKPSLLHARLRLASRPRPNTFICLQCRTLPQTHQFSSTRRQTADAEAGPGPDPDAKPDFTQRLRRRIWGSDNPPGQKDPYRRMTPEEKAAEEAEREAQNTEKAIARETASEVARRQDAGEYVPAENWDGLERIGGAKGWWEEAWDRENVYEGFLTQGLVGGAIMGDVRDLVRGVAVEIMALQRAGAALHEGAKAEWMSETLVEDIDIVRGEDGGFALREQTPDLIDELVEVLQRKEVEMEEVEEETAEETAEELSAEEQRLIEELHAEEDAAAAALEGQEETSTTQQELETVGTTKVHDPVYLELPLTDLAFKFALIKRLTYLTGTRIPDPRINAFHTLGDVADYLAEKPRPKKLAEILQAMPELKALPNVEIRTSKRTFVDKEMEIGRWKVIEAELRSRGLPVRKSERVYR